MKNLLFLFLCAFSSIICIGQGITNDSITLHFNDTDTKIKELEYGQSVIVALHGVRDFDVIDDDYRLKVVFNIKSLDGEILYSNPVDSDHFFFDPQSGLMKVQNIVYSPLTPGKYYDVEVVVLDRYSNKSITPKERIMLLEPFSGKNVKSVKSEGLEWVYPKLYRNSYPYTGSVFYKDETIKLEVMFKEFVADGKEFEYDVKVYDKKEVVVEYNDTKTGEGVLNYFDFSIDISQRVELVAGNEYTLELSLRSKDKKIETLTTAKFEVIEDPSFDKKPGGKMKYEKVHLLLDMDTISNSEMIEGKELRIVFDDISGIDVSNGMIGLRFYVRIVDLKGEVLFVPGEKIDIVRNVNGDGSIGDAWIYFTIAPHLPRRDQYIIEVLCADKNSGRFIMLKQPANIADYFKPVEITINSQKGYEVTMISLSQEDKIIDKTTFSPTERFDINAYYKVKDQPAEGDIFIFSIYMYNDKDEQVLDYKAETRAPEGEYDNVISNIVTRDDFPSGNYYVISTIRSVSGSHNLEHRLDFKLQR